MAATLPPAGGDDEDEDWPEPPRLRLLRRLVTALTVTLGLGMIVIAGTVAWRLVGSAPGGPGAAGPAAPPPAAGLTLPAGAEVLSLGASRAEILALVRGVDGAERLMIWRRSDGALMGAAPVRRGGATQGGADDAAPAKAPTDP